MVRGHGGAFQRRMGSAKAVVIEHRRKENAAEKDLRGVFQSVWFANQPAGKNGTGRASPNGGTQ